MTFGSIVGPNWLTHVKRVGINQTLFENLKPLSQKIFKNELNNPTFKLILKVSVKQK